MVTNTHFSQNQLHQLGCCRCWHPTLGTSKGLGAVLSSPKWVVLCLGNKSICSQETGRAQLHWYQSYSLPLTSSVPASHLGSALKAYTGGSFFKHTAASSWESSHRHRGPSDFPDPPILTTRDPSKWQKKTHSSSRSMCYLDFSALYSRIPSAGPQICTRSSLVSFNKSAPGETHEDFSKIILEHLYFLK